MTEQPALPPLPPPAAPPSYAASLGVAPGYVPPRAGSNVLGIVALITAVFALLGALGALLLMAIMFFAPVPATLTGEVRGVEAGVLLSGEDLADEVAGVVDRDFDFVDEMSCPDTPALAQGVVTVCHGVVGGAEWAAVVFFEDAEGAFTLSML